MEGVEKVEHFLFPVDGKVAKVAFRCEKKYLVSFTGEIVWRRECHFLHPWGTDHRSTGHFLGGLATGLQR